MQAKHSIHYTNLPAYFIAFDIYDTNTNTFYSRNKFHDILSQTSIPTIKVLFKGIIKTKDQLIHLLKTESHYKNEADSNRSIEGIYLRLDDDDTLIRRAKLVSAEFSEGITDHWTKTNMVKNIVKY